MRRVLTLVLLASILLSGCDEEYSVEMWPEGSRILRMFHYSGKITEQQRETLSAIYEQQIDANTFCSWFDDELPNDVGGAGFYVTIESNLGSAHFYSERFGGNDDLAYTLEQMDLCADRYLDFLTGWLEYELGNEPCFPALKQFCDYDLRQDAKNLLVYFWLSGIIDDYYAGAKEEFGARAKQFVVERGYFTPIELEHFIQRCEDDAEEETVRLTRQIITDQLGYSQSNAPANLLTFLTDANHAKASMQGYFRTTEFFQRAWEQNKRQQQDASAEPPEPDLDDYLFHDADCELDISGPSQKINVTLHCLCEPFSTNGTWGCNSSSVAWSKAIQGSSSLPTFVHAAWSEPNVMVQNDLFGLVLLQGEELSQYCIWFDTLAESQTKQWIRFLSILSAVENVEQVLSDFRFPDNATQGLDEDTTDLSGKGRKIILRAYKAAEEQ